jgi:hypothetical protein
MDPEGILNAWTAKVRINRASSTAMAAASAYSLSVLFLFNFLCGACSPNAASLENLREFNP